MLNAKYKMIDFIIDKTWLYQTLIFYDTRFLNLLTIRQLPAIQIEQRLMKLSNKHITGLECMISYNDMYADARLVYKKRPLINKNKKYYNQCQFLCYNDTISQLTLLSTCWIVMNIQMLWLLLIDSWNYNISLLLNLLILNMLLLLLSRMFLSCMNYLTWLYLTVVVSLFLHSGELYIQDWKSKHDSWSCIISKWTARLKLWTWLWNSICECTVHIFKMTGRDDSL